MLIIYRIFCRINFPLWWIVLRIRSLRGKEHKKRFIEKLGYINKKKPSEEVIWVHALGLGETLSLIFFLKRLSEVYPKKTILFTTSTLNAHLAFSKIDLDKNVVHQFAPIDNYQSLKRFLSYWKPSMALISEIDLWPMRVLEIKKSGIPLILFNSRMNKKKKNDRKPIFYVFSEILNCFDYIFLQDEASREFFLYFGVSDNIIEICGPFKSAGTYSYENKAYEKKIGQVFKNKIVWIAASLHKDEEIEILEAYRLAKNKLKNLTLIIVPRDPELISNTVKKCKHYSKNILVRKGDDESPSSKTDILVIGTIGELSTWYKLSHIAFIGNSLNYKSIKTGKNPFEAIQENCLVMHGPKMLEPGYSSLFKKGISEEVKDRLDISKVLVKYSTPEKRKARLLAGKKLLNENKQLIENFINKINFLQKKRER